jgi:hypothetical protein
MDEDETILLVAGAAVVAWWWLGPNEEGGPLGILRQAIDAGVDLVSRGARLTHAPYDTSTGVVPGNPQALADSTTLDLETYALARAISSEEGRSSNAAKLAVGWAMKNYADAHWGGSIAAALLHANYSPHSGYFGTQRNIESGTDGFNASDRYASTANDPYDGDGQIAFAIQNGTLPDPTGGAQYFDRPSGENADKVAANRIAAGLVQVAVDGVNDGDLRFWAYA